MLLLIKVRTQLLRAISWLPDVCHTSPLPIHAISGNNVIFILCPIERYSYEFIQKVPELVRPKGIGYYIKNRLGGGIGWRDVTKRFRLLPQNRGYTNVHTMRTNRL